MGDEKDGGTSPEAAALEREIRSQREFSLSEAIGRAAGDLLKGASPVPHKRQAELEIEQYLESRLADVEGALLLALQRHVRESETLLAESYDRPLVALARVTEHLLSSEGRLRRFVAEVDAEWGRLYSERPYFDREGAQPRPGDPYTMESVRAALSDLLADLRAAAGTETRKPGEGDREPLLG